MSAAADQSLRLRQEGAFVNAYFPTSSNREILLGSIRASLVRRQPRRAQFMTMMRAAAIDVRSGIERLEDDEEDA
jgi:hypothetical protein